MQTLYTLLLKDLSTRSDTDYANVKNNCQYLS